MRRILITTGMALAVFAAPVCHALGFGDIQLSSALNQPLQAEIPLLAVKPAERDQVSVDIATIETFQRFGVGRPAILDQIDVQVTPGARDTQLRVRLRSRVPIQEPFLTFLLEANWPGGRAIREYTVLLDPPVSPPKVSAAPPIPATKPAAPEPAAAPAPAKNLQPSRPLPRPAAAPVTAPPPAAAPASPPPRQSTEQQLASSPTPTPAQTQSSAPVRSQPNPVIQQEAPARPDPGEPSSKYGPVAARETLWAIAGKTVPADGITQNQMMLAIYQANPAAFDGNINLMRKGVVLQIPSENEIRGINVLAAKAEIDDQESSFKADRRRATKQAAQSSAKKPEIQAATLKLEPATLDDEEQSGESSSKPAEVANAETASLPEQLADLGGSNSTEQNTTASEDSEALENSLGTDDAVDATSTDTVSESDVAESTTEDAESASDDEYARTLQSINGDEAPEESLPAESAGSGGNVSDVAAEGNQQSASEDTQRASVATVESADATAESDANLPARITTAAETATDAAESAYQAATSGLSDIQKSVVPENLEPLISPRYLLILIAAIILIVCLLILWNRRRYKAVPADFVLDDTVDDFGLAVPPAGAASMAAASASAPAAVEPIDVDEVLMDADSHIAHELYDEALDVLAAGLAAHPEHPALQCKVLEVHHAAGDSAAFMSHVDSYFAIATPDDPEWDSVADMGRDFAPDDPRFQATQQQTSASAMIDDAPAVVAGAAATTAGLAASDTETTATDEIDNNADETDFDAFTADSAGDVASIDDKAEEDFASSIDEVPPAQTDDFTVLDLDDSLDFDLSDFDAAATAPEPNTPPPTEPAAGVLDINEQATDDDGLDFDISEMNLSDEPDTSTPASATASAENIDSANADSALEIDAETESQVADTEYSLDDNISDDDLKLNVDDGDAASELSIDDISDDAPSLAPTDINADLDESTDTDEEEVTTKLDLARAYIDMGEADMAESLLKEVQTQGNAEQQSEAKQLLERQG